jgi:hypothetical protein
VVVSPPDRVTSYLQALSSQLSWSQFVEIFSIKDLRKGDFYAEMCRIERWSGRSLRHKIGQCILPPFQILLVAPDEPCGA